MQIHVLRRLFLAMLALVGPTRADEPRAYDAKLPEFLQQHCIACHGPDVHERGLRFDKLSADLGNKATAATWAKVLDKLSRGEMPPQGEPRPPQKELAAFVGDLQKRLLEASLAKQKRDGRVVLRPLNRTEYETTLRDLLGDQVEVKSLLPDDNVAAGFDKLSAVLDVSSVHLLRYLDAAERAIVSAIPSRPPAEFKARLTGRGVTETMKTFKDHLDKSVKLVDDTLVMYVRTYGHVPCLTAMVPQAGRYRVRASLYAVGTEGKPLPVMLSCRDFYGREDDDVRGVRDVPADKPAIIEGEFDLKPRQVIVFTGWTLPTEREFETLHKKMPIDKYTGPGLAVEWVEVEGPLGEFPARGYQRLFSDVALKPRSVAKAEAEGRTVPPSTAKRDEGQWAADPLVMVSTKPQEDAERLIRAFLPIAFRRPVDNDLAGYFVKVAHDQLAKGLSFQEAMVIAYKTALCSPHFLFLTELPADAEKGPRLDDYAVASRLSYFLWSSLPDAELFKLASERKLTQPAVLRAEVERMLKDPKARRFTENFAGQWLELQNINATSPDPQIYGEFDPFLFWSMPRETELFFDEILRNDLPLTDFVDSKWTFLNQRLAEHYGIPGVVGGELKKTEIPPGSHRGGVLTQASILKITADGTRTSPVLRGKWVLEHILGQSPEPPPPDIPTIEPDIRGATTIRQQLDKHRNIAACAVCHVHIDPPGFALESFDVIGSWRDFYRATQQVGKGMASLPNYPARKVFRGPDVELGGKTADDRAFGDVDEYKKILMSDKDQLARCLTQKLMVYATGADIQFADREVVEQIVANCRAKNYGFRSLIHEVVESRVFLNK